MSFLKKSLWISAVFAVLIAAAASAGQKPPAPDGRMRKTQLENFTLVSEYEISKEDLLDVRRHLTNVRRDVGRDLGFSSRSLEVILSEESTFREYTEMPKEVLGFYDGRIHIPLPSAASSEAALQATLWHEYTHAVIHELARGKCPVWMQEGFAVFEESKIRKRSLDLLAEAIRASGELPYDLSTIDEALQNIRDRDAKGAATAYEQAYVWVDYLFSRFSIATIRQALESIGRGMTPAEAMKAAFHLSKAQIEERWLEHARELTGA